MTFQVERGKGHESPAPETQEAYFRWLEPLGRAGASGGSPVGR